ncbi:MAG: PD40 domain-containing protein [Phycisphaeraceae bacterium]|nr:PD40 domain-containing protein [Phycisphaeraceae bacterium]
MSIVRNSRGAVSVIAFLAGTAIGAIAAAGAAADITPSGSMLRWPDVSKSHICFVYANDIWIVPRTGGLASPVANPPGQEAFPKFSADGKSIAFVGNYDGGRDLYIVDLDTSLAGNPARRVTHHPGAENLADWNPDGSLLFMGNGFAGLPRQTQLLKVPAEGGLPTHLPVPYAGFGSISPDGTWLAYTPHSTDTRTWKRYRGGMATDVWLFNLKDNSSKRITDWEGTDTIPMWVPGGDGKVVYFLSDRGPEHRLNIWSYNLGTGASTQVTKFTEFDVRWPSIGPGPNGKGEIVFQHGSELRLLDLATGKDAVVKVTIPGDRPTLRSRTVDASGLTRGASISHSGKRVAVESRGDIWSIPAKEGVTRNLTRTDGIFERDPAWSPDGRWIAYFSDESGEYELWVRPSDATPPEKKNDKASKDGDAADSGDATSAADPRKLTSLGAGFRYSPLWSPDSKHIAFTDKGGALFLTNAATGETAEIDRDPWAASVWKSFSHDSTWLAYERSDENNRNNCVWLFNVVTGEKHKVTSEMTSCSAPTFDAKGDWLFMRSARTFSAPIYSDLDTTFIYSGTQVLLAVPLRSDVKNPWAVKSDEETIKLDKKSEAKDSKDSEKKDGKSAGTAESAADDGISGSWQGFAEIPGENGQKINLPFALNVTLNPDGSLSGSIVSAMGTMPVTGGSFDKASGMLTISIRTPDGEAGTISGTVKGESFTGTWIGGDQSGPVTMTRESKAAPKSAEAKDADKDDDKKDAEKKDEKKEALKIELDGLEQRAIQLPIGSGNFGAMAVTEDNKLIYARGPARGGQDPWSIKIYDLADESKEEKTVTSGAASFALSADRKKLIVWRGGGNITIMDPAAGGGKSSNPPVNNLWMQIDPRKEWSQIFTDVYRLQRDFFYEPTLHGVDWDAMRNRYASMLADCVTREDVNWVIAEFISELNVGHAYVTGPGDVSSSGPSRPVGMLGADYELVPASGDSPAAYRITKIHAGGIADTDARGPLSQLGVNAKVGDFLLAVNGQPIDTTRDPFAAFIGTAGRPTQITLSDKPVIDGSERVVLVTPIGDETNLRFRTWIDANRRYVHEKSGGRIGYIYVPNTGIDGQNELFRQFAGERGREALIIDERWNGGGQIPTRFIELLNRPALNYWARRDGKDWVWPPDAHNGPKCMLINGLAGSGGDMFPHLFKQVGLGKLIGTRTWGGLVGISGNPGLIDGGAISVPTFGFYETDGTWGIEGHGVDPDIEVIDDPALMVNGGDPQLDRAIDLMLSELQTKPYAPPARPKSPNRAGMGIAEEDK